MARKRHSPESIAAVLRKAESGMPLAKLAREGEVHENTIHLWKKKYGQLGTTEIPGNQRATRREYPPKAPGC